MNELCQLQKQRSISGAGRKIMNTFRNGKKAYQHKTHAMRSAYVIMNIANRAV